jgi:ssDNA-binding Zn-finger/Zn-ribbon topoisomerase 1
MRTSCFSCHGLIIVGPDGLVSAHHDPEELDPTEDNLCFRSDKSFSVHENPTKTDCPKCGDQGVYLNSLGQFIEHFDASYEFCDFSGHSATELCCLEVQNQAQEKDDWSELIGAEEEEHIDE